MFIASKENKIEGQYRRIEAMYRQGYSTDEIVRATELNRMDVLEVTQRIFALDMIRKGFR